MIEFTLFCSYLSKNKVIKGHIFLLLYNNITCSCYNLISVPYPVGWPQQLWDWDARVLYNTPLLSFPSHLLSSLPLLYVYADDVSKHSSLPP